jgi:hypothetical protein
MAKRAKRQSKASARKAKGRGKQAAASRSAKRPKMSAKAARPKPAGASRGARRKAAPSRAAKTPRLNRARRTLDETVQTPPSSLDMVRRGTAARTGRAELAQSRELHGPMTSAITGGDVDVNLENAYFSGDEAPGGDNPTPDQDIVDDIGKAIGIEYQDSEELKASDKVTERDKHRWELDPASAEDYKERK